MANYIAIVHKDAESEFGGSFPDFPGFITAGKDIDEAKDVAQDRPFVVIETTESPLAFCLSGQDLCSCLFTHGYISENGSPFAGNGFDPKSPI